MPPAAFGWLPVLKSNAYGHGLVIVAKILDGEEIPFFCLDSYHEALILRNEGIKSKILVIGYTLAENISKRGLPGVSFTLTGMDDIRSAAEKIRRPVNFHLKIDTGMHRQGIQESQFRKPLSFSKAIKTSFLKEF